MIVILNRAAGSSKGTTDENIRELFAAHGVEARLVHPDEETDLSALASNAVESSEDIIVAGGGDGTISGVAAVLAGTGKILGVLPMGTLNHFAKDLGIPLDPAAAVEIIVQGHVEDVDAAEVNDRLFINNSSLGIYPKIVAKREAQQEQLGRSKWPSFFWAAIHSLKRYPFLNLRLTIEGKELNRKTAFLFIGNNEYEIAGFKLGGRTCLNAGKLGLYLARSTGRLGLFRLGFNALLGRLNQEDDFEAFCVEDATIEAHKSQLLVATDGEVTMMETPLHYRIRPQALRVLVPPPKNAA